MEVGVTSTKDRRVLIGGGMEVSTYESSDSE